MPFQGVRKTPSYVLYQTTEDCKAIFEAYPRIPERQAAWAEAHPTKLILARHFHQQPCAQLEEATTAKEPIDLNTLIDDITDYISGQLRLKRADGTLSDEEQKQSVKLQNKYNGRKWNRQR